MSFRLGGTDGVAIEAAKWEWALRELGFERLFGGGAGQGEIYLIEGLAMDADEPPSHAELERRFRTPISSWSRTCAPSLSTPARCVSGRRRPQVEARGPQPP